MNKNTKQKTIDEDSLIINKLGPQVCECIIKKLPTNVIRFINGS